MIYLAQYRFGTRLEMIGGEFSFIVEASSQEEAELKLCILLEEAIKIEEWFPAPCRILLWLLAEMDSLPASGLAFHLRRRKLGEYEHDHYPLTYMPAHSVRILFDRNAQPFTEIPVPLFFVERDRTLSFPTENIPPALW